MKRLIKFLIIIVILGYAINFTSFAVFDDKNNVNKLDLVNDQIESSNEVEDLLLNNNINEVETSIIENINENEENLMNEYTSTNESYIADTSVEIDKLKTNDAIVKQVNGIWRIVINGKVDYSYTGLGKNESGTWLVKDGTIKFDYTGDYTDVDGNIYIVEKNRVLTDLEKVMFVHNAWVMVRGGKVDYTYTGIGSNETGIWYVRNGIVDFGYNNTYYEGDKAHIIEGGRVFVTVPKNTTKVMEINKNWRMVINGKVEYNYDGIGTNENGTWYVKNGTIKFNYTGKYIDKNGKEYIIQKNEAVTKVMQINGIWTMVIRGLVDYSYTGIGKNEFGTWYIEKGIVNWNHNGTVIDGNEAYIIESGKVLVIVPKTTTKVMEINKIWRMVINGKVEYGYKGIGANEFGTWYVENGKVNFDYTGTFKNTDGKTYIIEKSRVMTNITNVRQIDGIWRMVKNGIVDYSYTGIGKNEFGTWYVENGIVNFNYKNTYYEGDKAYIIEGGKVLLTVQKNTTKVMEVNKNWRMVKNGKVEYDYEGIGTNESGTWYVQNGTINFDYTGIYKEKDGKTYVIEKNRVMTNMTKVLLIDDGFWRMVINGIVNYNFTGIGKNEYGTWYVENGIVNFNYKNTYYEGDKAYIIEEGKVQAIVSKDTTKVMEINRNWRMVVKGKVEYDYEGRGVNESGTWYVKNGTIKFDYTGTYKDKDGKTYVIEKNRVMTNMTKVLLIDDGFWRMVINGIVNYNFTGIGKNEYGTWYVQKGAVNFNYTDTYYEGNTAYIIERGKVEVTVDKNTTSVILVNTVWRMVKNGKVDYGFNGVGTNSSGMWVLRNGAVDFNYTAKEYRDSDGSIYNIKKGKVREVISRAGHPGTMWIDAPVNGNNYGTKTIRVMGWALSQDKGDIIQIFIDDKFVGEPGRVSREDVFKAFPNQYGGRNSTPYPGFDVNAYVSGLSRGRHTLTVVNLAADKKTIIQSREIEFNLVRLANAKGIDVSHYQEDIDWNTVKRNGVDFAIIRIGYYVSSRNELVQDRKFERNYNECRRLGIAVGGYFYSYAFNAKEGSVEADKCISILKGRHFDLPIFLDVEDPLQEPIDRNSLTDACVAFCDKMNRNGYSSGVYANLKFLNNHLDRGRLEKYNIWLAQWKVSTPSYTGRYDIWQYTNEGRVPGINGFVDMNYAYKKYF